MREQMNGQMGSGPRYMDEWMDREGPGYIDG